MSIANFSGSSISNTYQRVVQTDGTYLADGTGSIISLLNITSSIAISSSYSNYAVTASYLENYIPPFPYTGSAEITGSLKVIGPFTASSALVTGNVVVLGTASINTLVVNQTQLSTGSNQLGDAANDFQTLFGTVRIPTGSLTITGSALISGSGRALEVYGMTQFYGNVLAPGLATIPNVANKTLYFDEDNGNIYVGPTFTESDTLNTVTNRGNTTNNNITVGNLTANTGSFRTGLTITGSLAITSSGTGSSLQIYKSGSTVVDIQGSTGQLFSITDSLTGSLFSVNTVAGLPVIEAFSDNTVNIGKFGTYPIKVVATGTLASITGSITGSFTGSLLGSATSASYAATASFVNPLTQSVLIRGLGTTSATTAFLVQNSAGSTNAQIYDDGQWFIGTGNIRITGESGNFKFDTAAGNVANIGHWGINFQPLGYSTKVSISNIISITGSVYASGSQIINGNVIIGGTTDLGYKLQVSGSGNFNNNLTVTGSFTAIGSAFISGSDNIIRPNALIGGVSDNTVITEDNVFGRGFMGIGTTIAPGASGNRNLRIITPTDGGSGTISIGYWKFGVGAFWNRALSISNSPSIPHLMLQPDAGNTVIGTSTDIGAELGIRGSGTTSATTALRVENSSTTARLTILDDGTSAFNTSQLFISSSGNTGVSTSSPRVRLQVGDKVIDDNGYTYDSGSAMIIHPTQTSATVLNDPKEVLVLARQGLAGQAFGAAAALEISRYENPGTNSRTRLDFKLAHDSFIGFSNRVMTMLSNGNIGIGTTSPTARLEIKGAGTTSATKALTIQNASSTQVATVDDTGRIFTGGVDSGSASDRLVIQNDFWSSIFLDAGLPGEAGHKVGIISRRDYGQPFYIELGSGGNRVLDSFEGGAGLQVPSVLTQGVRTWQSLETNGSYHHIHSPFGSWPSGIKLTNPTTNTGSTDGVYMGLWTSGVDARLWNYETTGKWDIGVGNITQATVTTSSVTINSVLTLTPQNPLPTSGVPTGSFAVSSSTPPKPYFWDGTSWNALY